VAPRFSDSRMSRSDTAYGLRHPLSGVCLSEHGDPYDSQPRPERRPNLTQLNVPIAIRSLNPEINPASLGSTPVF